MGKVRMVKLKRITVENDNENAEKNKENFKQMYIETLYQYYKNQFK